MGPLRGRLTRARGSALAAACAPMLLPARAVAGVCETVRPGWDGTPVSALQEAAYLFSTPLSLILLLATALAVRLRSQWGVLAVCLGWSGLVTFHAFFDPTAGAAMAEGCAGSPVL